MSKEKGAKTEKAPKEKGPMNSQRKGTGTEKETRLKKKT